MSAVTCIWDEVWRILVPTESVLADVARSQSLRPVMEELLTGIEALGKLKLYGKHTSTSRSVFLPKALHGAKICTQHSEDDLKEAMNALIVRGILVPDWEFRGEGGSPKVRDSGRHAKVGVWFADGYLSKAIEALKSAS